MAGGVVVFGRRSRTELKLPPTAMCARNVVARAGGIWGGEILRVAQNDSFSFPPTRLRGLYLEGRAQAPASGAKPLPNSSVKAWFAAGKGRLIGGSARFLAAPNDRGVRSERSW